MKTLLALHGFTQNGVAMRESMRAIETRLPASLRVVYPDAPNVCAAESVERLFAQWKAPRPAPPHLCWWDATDDGRTYRGWEATRSQLAPLLGGPEPVGVLGFSQGAILATVLAGLASRGELPNLACVVLIAGRTPRAEVLAPLFAAPLRIPSLHVWGERDALNGDGAVLLSERFDAAQRSIAIWPGPHVVPGEGPAADAIVDFLTRHA